MSAPSSVTLDPIRFGFSVIFLIYCPTISLASFLVARCRQGLEPNALRALFLFLREMPAFSAGIFFSPSLQAEHGTVHMPGFLLFY